MKKTVIYATALLSLLLLSKCSKNTSCKCREYDATDNYYYGSKSFDPASFGASNCSDLETKLRIEALQFGYDEIFDCSKE